MSAGHCPDEMGQDAKAACKSGEEEELRIDSGGLRLKVGGSGFSVRWCFGFCAIFLLQAVGFAQEGKGRESSAADWRQEICARIFGRGILFERGVLEKVKALPNGERFYLDGDGDGRPEEVWYVDADVRHEERCRPIVVRVIDEDGDLELGGEGDLDSDLYVADWKGDGIIDAIIDYEDTDGDQDVDEMGIYSFAPNDRYVKANTMRVWWGRDIGDDNLLWYNVNYGYQQGQCQWRCHFGGEEMFAAFAFDPKKGEWVSTWENPFLFYDPDGDGNSETAVRFSGFAGEVESVRYSFDADNDTFGENYYDYDFSVTAIAPGTRYITKEVKGPDSSDLSFPREEGMSISLRGIPTDRFLAHDRGREFAESAAWARAVLTWDEIDSNTEGLGTKDPHERWEGVIAHPSKDFPQIGGPTCGAANKRNEVDVDHESPMRLYYSPVDRRIHLRGMDEGWIHVDYDFDGKVDMNYTYEDADGDGIIDTRQVDLDGDGKPEQTWKSSSQEVRWLSFSYGELTRFYQRQLRRSIAENQGLIDIMKAVLMRVERAFSMDEVEGFFVEELANWMAEKGLGRKIRKSAEGARYYQDLVRDRYYFRLQKALRNEEVARKIRECYGQGDFAAVTDLLRREFPECGEAADKAEKRCRHFRRRVAITIRNPVELYRGNEPVSIPLEAIVKGCPDFNADCCCLVAPERRIDWRGIPFQIDRLGPDESAELFFLAELRPRETATFYLYYSAQGDEPRSFPTRTAAAVGWLPDNIGWESDRVGYRAHRGQFDFFGKKKRTLVVKSFRGDTYHEEQWWGMDALNVGKTSGIGGLTLLVNGEAYPVQDPDGMGKVRFRNRVLLEGPLRTMVETVASEVGGGGEKFTVRVRCSAIAGRQDTEVRVAVSPKGGGSEVEVAPGFARLSNEGFFLNSQLGFFGSRGWQTPGIGEIGMAVIFPPERYVGFVEEKGERRIVLSLRRDGEVSYLLIGDWKRGRRFPYSPTIDNWRKDVREIALRYHHPVRWVIGTAESVE